MYPHKVEQTNKPPITNDPRRGQDTKKPPSPSGPGGFFLSGTAPAEGIIPAVSYSFCVYLVPDFSI